MKNKCSVCGRPILPYHTSRNGTRIKPRFIVVRGYMRSEDRECVQEIKEILRQAPKSKVCADCVRAQWLKEKGLVEKCVTV